jgi:hypothetical protein
MTDENIESHASRFLGNPARVAGPGRGLNLDGPAAALEDVADGRGRPPMRARRKWIGDQQRAGH